jgi:hypothetical protein
MRPISAQMMMKIEDRADQEGRGSVWRACLAVGRSCDHAGLEGMVMEMAIGYCNGLGATNLNHLERLCAENLPGAKGEFREALVALKNAVEMAPKNTKRRAVDNRQELWVRLDRLLDQ